MLSYGLTAGISQLRAVSIPDEAATLKAEETVSAAIDVGFEACEADSVQAAIEAITSADSNARILICGSLYLAGHVLRENV